jgi:signal transduction histidine kinase
MQISSSFLRKYRTLIAAVGVFFILSVGIFGVNYRLSLQFADDAGRINDAGKLRGLSQQYAKALLSLKQELGSGESIQTSQAQMSEAAEQIDGLLVLGKRRAADAAETELLDKVEKRWRPMAQTGAALFQAAPETISADLVQIALDRTVANNVRLLADVDDLTAHLEGVAAERAARLKLIQSIAIVLASLNFLFIVVYALRSLQRADALAEAARRETEQILRTVGEGLFLIGRDGRVGGQRSVQLEKIFPRPLPAGSSFFEQLAPLVSAKTLNAARQYFDLLFNPKVKASLIASLNPLRRVEIIDPAKGPLFPLYLDIDLHPVKDTAGGQTGSVMVSVVDVSKAVYLERELQNAEERAQSEMALLLGVLENDPAVVAEFLAAADERLAEANQGMRTVQAEHAAYLALVNDLFRRVHSIKGEAAALALNTIADAAHRFEESLSEVRAQPLIRGDDLIRLATGLGELTTEIAKIRKLTDKLASYGGKVGAGGTAITGENDADLDVGQAVHSLQRLALAVACDLGKRVRFETALAHLEDLPAPIRRLLREGLPQLVRNAVAHGIEAESERLGAGKPAEGVVRVELNRTDPQSIELVVSDDGRGIDLARLRTRMIATGRRTAQEVAAMSDKEIIASIFEPGMTTETAAHAHAGRGVGLDLVMALVRSSGARLRVASTPNAFTRFTLQWSPA